MPSQKPKIQGVVDQSEFQAFQDWKTQQGLTSDAAAIKRLIQLVITSEITGDNLSASPEITGDNRDLLGKSNA